MQLVSKNFPFYLEFISLSFYTMLYNIKHVTNQGLFMELRVTKDKIEKSNIIAKTTKGNSKSQTKENIHKNHRLRLKNQFIENGIDSLTDIQKLELLLFYAIPQKDTNPIAHKLLKEFGTISHIMSAKHSELMKVDGIKESSATLIKFFGSMLNYVSRADCDDIIDSSAKAKNYATKYFAHVSVEQFYVFCLTKANKVKKAFLINSGSTSEVNVQIRNITEKALDTNCNRMIIAHNHPMGRAIMSAQDCRFTYSLLCSCILNNIELIDHVVVGTDRTISLYEQDILPQLKRKAAETIQITPDNSTFVSETPEGYEKSMIDTPEPFEDA